jgi:hypothetical protein
MECDGRTKESWKERDEKKKGMGGRRKEKIASDGNLMCVIHLSYRWTTKLFQIDQHIDQQNCHKISYICENIHPEDIQ